jgi:hypothetical protein
LEINSRYGHKYGLVPDAEFEFLWNTCEARSPSITAQGKGGMQRWLGKKLKGNDRKAAKLRWLGKKLKGNDRKGNDRNLSWIIQLSKY